MNIARLRHTPSSGWSDPFPEWDGERTLVLVFGAAEYRCNPEPVDQLRAAYPTSHLLGCSTAGEIHGTEVADGTLSVAIARFQNTRLRCADARVASMADSEAAGRNVAEALFEDDLAGMFVLSNGVGVNGTALVGGLNSVMPEQVVVTGGLAGDGPRFERTWTLLGDSVEESRVVAVGFYGSDVIISHGSRGGWDIFGPERTVTRSEGSVLFELDGRPALDLYREYLGDLADGLPATGLLFPLALRQDDADSNQVVRTILGIDEQAGSMTFAGDVPVGHRAQLMQANFDRLVMGAETAAEAALLSANGSPGLTIAISCVGRRLVLEEHTEEEVEAVADILGPNMTQVGFYSYGEISPFTDGRCDLHNQTMTLTTFAESG